MTTTADSFFSKEDNQAILRGFQMTLESIPPIASPAPNVIPALKHFIRPLVSHANVFDAHCQTNIGWVGKQFMGRLIEFPKTNVEQRTTALMEIFTLSYRFLCELEFSQPGELAFELRDIKTFVDENLDAFPVAFQRQLIYANYIMPANVTKRLINSPALTEFKAFAETAKAATDLKASWDKELAEKNEQINALRDGLNRVTTTYNFVGLVNGFESLASVKRAERSRTFRFLIALGVVMVVPVAVQLGFTAFNIAAIESHRSTLVYSLPALIALEVILLYFFRVTLSHFRSATAQLQQISLRITMCQFIQSYSEFSTKIKKVDASALDKFENLVFSPISADTGSIPSTFDGLEQIGKIFNSVRPK